MVKRNKTTEKQTIFILGMLLLASVIVVLPVAFSGVPTGSDMPQHFQFAITFLNSLQNGNLYPSLADATNGGFGDVGIRFYPPLAYYVMVGFRCLAGNWFDASILTFTFWFFVSGVGMYYWCREYFSENASLAAAVVYICMPYHVNQIYNASTYAEFAASSILPFSFLFVTRVCRFGKTTDVIGLAVFYSILVLTHLPLTIIGSISLLIYSILTIEKNKAFQTLIKLSTAVFLGLLMSSFYWVRMVGELNFVKHTAAQFTANDYDFHSNFLCSFLYKLFSEIDYRSSWFCDLMLLVSVSVFVPCALIFYKWSKEKRGQKLLNVSVLFVFSIFIATPLSVVIWEKLPLLEKIQFPWRWLAITSITAAFFVAACYKGLLDLFHTKARPTALLTVGLIIVSVIFTFTRVIKPSNQMPREDFSIQTKYLLNSGSYECWWAVWTQKEAMTAGQKASATDRPAQIISWQPAERRIEFPAGNPTAARISTFYYPHWRATVNNQPAEVKSDDNGAIIIALPAEAADVKIWFQEPVPVRIASYLSIFIWLGLGIAGIFAVKKNLFSLYFSNAKPF